ncbi:MAG: hypothetical protein HUU56_09175 [Bdellovibrionaceae bacterium]|nr:hypothetical protein [Pseudobdellovibrionaceae bacterium]
MVKKILGLFFLFLAFGCGKVKNSSSSDAATATGTEEFVSAATILREKCASCHQHTAWSSYSETDFVSKKLVTKKSPASSELYTRVRGNDTGIAGDMPEGQSNLSQTEMSTLKTWINSIN